jgi:hypothetical protein
VDGGDEGEEEEEGGGDDDGEAGDGDGEGEGEGEGDEEGAGAAQHPPPPPPLPPHGGGGEPPAHAPGGGGGGGGAVDVNVDFNDRQVAALERLLMAAVMREDTVVDDLGDVAAADAAGNDDGEVSDADDAGGAVVPPPQVIAAPSGPGSPVDRRSEEPVLIRNGAHARDVTTRLAEWSVLRAGNLAGRNLLVPSLQRLVPGHMRNTSRTVRRLGLALPTSVMRAWVKFEGASPHVAHVSADAMAVAGVPNVVSVASIASAAARAVTRAGAPTVPLHMPAATSVSHYDVSRFTYDHHHSRRLVAATPRVTPAPSLHVGPVGSGGGAEAVSGVSSPAPPPPPSLPPPNPRDIFTQADVAAASLPPPRSHAPGPATAAGGTQFVPVGRTAGTSAASGGHSSGAAPSDEVDITLLHLQQHK